MNRFLYIVLLATVASIFNQTAVAQEITGTFSSSEVSGQTLYLSALSGRKVTKIDSVKIGSDLSFTFANTRREIGVYRLSFDKDHRLSIISNPKESIIQLDFEGMDLLDGLTVLQSEENRAFGEFNYIKAEASDKKRKINEEKKKIPKNYKQRRAELEVKKELIDKKFGMNIQPLIDSYSGSFFATVAKAYQYPDFAAYKAKGTGKKYEAENSFIKDHFFDSIDFTDIRLTNTPIYKERIYKYLVRYTPYNEPGLIRTVDKVMGLAEGHDETKEHILNYFLDHFNANGPKLMLQFVLENYLLDESCSEMAVEDRYRMMAGEYEALMPGNKAPDLSIPNTVGLSKSLSSLVSANKATVLFFWSSHCHFCEKVMPSVKDFHQKYKSQGIEVIGISLDSKKDAWLGGIAKNNTGWVHLSELKGYKSEVALEYRIHKTPYFYVLDKDMNIIGKPAGIQQVEKVIQDKVLR